MPYVVCLPINWQIMKRTCVLRDVNVTAFVPSVILEKSVVLHLYPWNVKQKEIFTPTTGRVCLLYVVTARFTFNTFLVLIYYMPMSVR